MAILMWVILASGGVAVVAMAAQSPARAWALIPLTLIAALVYELLWQPRVTVDDEQVVLDDLFYTVEIPWTTVIGVDTRWALTIMTPTRSYRSSAAPAPGASVRTRVGRDSNSPQVGRDGSVRKSDALGTDSGDAAHIVRRRWMELVESERVPIGRADLDRPVVRVHRVAVIAIALLSAASVLALLSL